MARFEQNGVVFHTEGNAGHGTALVGSELDVVPTYVAPSGDAASLAGATLTARVEVYKARFDDEGRLVAFVGNALDAATGVAVDALSGQEAENKGKFRLRVGRDALPVRYRNPAVSAVVLPTLAIWVVFEWPNGTVGQARFALGYRRGAGSPAPEDAPSRDVASSSADRVRDLLMGLAGEERLDASAVRNLPGGGAGLTEAQVDMRVSFGTQAPARRASADRWPKSKLPIDAVYENTQRFTAADRAKLDGVEAGAEVNVNADWTGSGDAAILHKPDVLSQADVDARVVAGTAAEARAGNSARWPVGKVPTLATLGGQTQSQVDARVEAGTLAEARAGNTGRWAKAKVPSDTIYTGTQRFTPELSTKLASIESNAKDDQSGPEIASLLVALTGNARLPYSAIRGTPNIPTLPAEVGQAEAEAGTSGTARLWTAERVNQAIQALAPSGGGGGGLNQAAVDARVVALRPRFVVDSRPSAAVTQTQATADTWTDWIAVETTRALAAGETGLVVVAGEINGTSNTSAGGGDRILVQVRVARTRASVDTVLMEEQLYLRNLGNAGANMNIASRTASGAIIWFDTAEEGDTYKIEARFIPQVAGRTLTYDTSNNGLFVASV